MAKKVLFGITWTWKKVLGLILGFLGIGTLTSCYGMPDDFYGDLKRPSIDVYINGIVKGDIDGDGQTEPVPGISVETSRSKTETTNNGSFEILTSYYEDSGYDYIYFSDIDAEENGFFESKYMEPQYSDENVIYDENKGAEVQDIGVIELQKYTSSDDTETTE